MARCEGQHGLSWLGWQGWVQGDVGLGRCDPVMFPCSCLVHPEPRVTVSAGALPVPVPSVGWPCPGEVSV